MQVLNYIFLVSYLIFRSTLLPTPLMTACYFLEGDNFLHEVVVSFYSTVHMPGTRGIITMLDAQHCSSGHTPQARHERISTRLEQAYACVRLTLA